MGGGACEPSANQCRTRSTNLKQSDENPCGLNLESQSTINEQQSTMQWAFVISMCRVFFTPLARPTNIISCGGVAGNAWQVSVKRMPKEAKRAEAPQIATESAFQPAPKSSKESGSTANSDRICFPVSAQKQQRERKHSK